VNTLGVIAAARDMLVLGLLLVSPFLAAAIVATFLIGLFQAGTRINDVTLSFVPRFVAIMLVVYLASSWVSVRMAGYIERSMIAATSIE